MRKRRTTPAVPAARPKGEQAMDTVIYEQIRQALKDEVPGAVA